MPRLFKNHVGIEWPLLLQENVDQTLRFTAAGAFKHSSPQFTKHIEDIRHSVPLLFHNLEARDDVGEEMKESVDHLQP